jgi:uncharacterized membrane protein YqgA involved in biofilm formation
LTGTFINVGTVLLGTLIGVVIGRRLPGGLQERVLAGLGLVTLVRRRVSRATASTRASRRGS